MFTNNGLTLYRREQPENGRKEEKILTTARPCTRILTGKGVGKLRWNDAPTENGSIGESWKP